MSLRKSKAAPAEAATAGRKKAKPANDPWTCSAATKKLAEAKLAESGLDLARVKPRGVIAVDSARQLLATAPDAPALVFLWQQADGTYVPQVRLLGDLAELKKRFGGQVARYLCPPGCGPLLFRPRAGKLEVFSEGALKALAAIDAGINAASFLGISALYAARTEEEKAAGMRKELMRQLAALAEAGEIAERPFVVFDQDLDREKRKECERYAQELRSLLAPYGIAARIVVLPRDGLASGQKASIDDHWARLLRQHKNNRKAAAKALRALFEAHIIAGSEAPKLLDLKALATVSPEPPRFLIQDFLPEGEVTLLAGHGGSMKSTIALMQAVCLAAGMTWWGFDVPRRRVAFFSYEDNQARLHWRLSRICADLGIKLEALDGRLLVFDGVRTEAILFGNGTDGIETTAAYDWVGDQIAKHRIQVIMIDGISDTYASNENNRAAVKAFVRKIHALVPDDGAGLLIAHVDKGSAKNPETSQGYSGSTGWHNGVRSRSYIFPCWNDDDDNEGIGGPKRKGPPDFYTIEVQKNNHGEVGRTVTFAWDKDKALPTVAEGKGATYGEARIVEDDELRATLLDLFKAAEDRNDPVPTSMTNGRTMMAAITAMEGCPGALKGKLNRKRLKSLVEALRQQGKIYEGTAPAPGRKTRSVYRVHAAPEAARVVPIPTSERADSDRKMRY